MYLVGVGYSLEMFAKYAPSKWCSGGVVLLIEVQLWCSAAH